MKERRNGVVLSYVNIVLKNVVNIMYVPILLNFLGTAEYGLFQMSAQVIGMLSLLSFGLAGSYVRFYWLEKNKSDRDVNKLNSVYLGMFTLIALVALIGSIVISMNGNVLFGNTYSKSDVLLAESLMVILGVNVAVTFISNVFESYIIVKQKFTIQQLRILLATILQPVMVIMFLKLGAGALGVAVTQTFLSIVFIIWNVIYAMKYLCMKFEMPNFVHAKSIMKEVIVFSGFLFLNQLVDIVNNNYPSIILGKINGATSVAIFMIAIQIKNIFYQLSLSISNVFIPQVNELVMQKDNSKRLNTLMTKIGKLQLAILGYLFGGFIVIGEMFIYLWAGKEFEQAYWIVIVLVAPAIIPLSQSLGIEIQKSKNLHKFRLTIMAVMCAANAFMTINFIAKFGVIGAAIGSAIGLIIVNTLIVNVYNHKVVGLNMVTFWKKNGFMLFVPGIGAVIAHTTKLIIGSQTIQTEIVAILLYCIVTPVLMWLIAISRNEKSQILSLLRNRTRTKKRAIM
ncbi:lipopolysaccharide biosynthesis protein [Weissella cibaria]|uniref:lipopolysaccharide biosynthesis protein n=1 Tax=Weissella cibaria TaxID=137591 RepID=UPI001899F698|nr:oligosaccharide flippase family protein [Weissella cibaria]